MQCYRARITSLFRAYAPLKRDTEGLYCNDSIRAGIYSAFGAVQELLIQLESLFTHARCDFRSDVIERLFDETLSLLNIHATYPGVVVYRISARGGSIERVTPVVLTQALIDIVQCLRLPIYEGMVNLSLLGALALRQESGLAADIAMAWAILLRDASAAVRGFLEEVLFDLEARPPEDPYIAMLSEFYSIVRSTFLSEAGSDDRLALTLGVAFAALGELVTSVDFGTDYCAQMHFFSSMHEIARIVPRLLQYFEVRDSFGA